MNGLWRAMRRGRKLPMLVAIAIGTALLVAGITRATPIPAPTVTSFTPTSGAVGTSVDITGTGFTGATSVVFDSTAATSFTVNSDTDITTTVPDGATSGPISVTAPGGTAASADTFSVPPPVVAPTVTSFTPTSGAPGDAVTITGTGFTTASEVDFNGTPADSFTPASDTTITTTVPAAATTGPITVFNGGGQVDSSTPFTVTSGGGGGGGGGGPSIDFQGPTTLGVVPGDTAHLGYDVNPGGTLSGSQSICAYGDTSQGALPTGLSSSGDTYDVSTSPTPSTVDVLVDPSTPDGSYTVYLGLCDGSLYSGAYTITVSSSGGSPSYTPTLDQYDFTVAAGSSFSPHLTIAGDPGFTGTVHPFIATSPGDSTPPDGFFPQPWADISVPSVQQDEDLPISIDPGLAPGDYSFYIGTAVFGMPENDLQITVHVTAANPSPFAGVVQSLVAQLDPSTTSVSSGDTFSGGENFDAQIVNGGGTLQSPEITASSDADPGFSPAPSSWPLTDGPGADLVNPGDFFSMSELDGTQGGSTLPGQTVTSNFDASLTPGAIPAGGGDATATFDITPQVTADQLDVEVDTQGPGFDYGAITGETFPDTTTEQVINDSVDSGHLSWLIANPIAGQTYELTVTVNQPNDGGTDIPFQPSVRTMLGVAGTSSLSGSGTSLDVPAPDLGSNGTFTFQSANPVDWTGERLDITELDFGALSTTGGGGGGGGGDSGAGSVTATPSVFTAGSTGSIDFTYTADTGGLSNGTVAVVVPPDWTPPSTDSLDPGYVHVTSGGGGSAQVSVGDDGQTVYVTGLNMNAGDTFTLTYGNNAAVGSPGPASFEVLEQSTDDGSHSNLSDLAEQPGIDVVSADGGGTVTAQDQNGNSPPALGTSQDGTTLTFTYTADDGGLQNGTVTLVVPDTWPVPQGNDATQTGYTTIDAPGASWSASGHTITVSNLTLNGGDSFDIFYGDTSYGANPGAAVTTPAQAESNTWQMQEASAPGNTLTDIASGSPVVTVTPGNGLGTMTASPSAFHVGDTNKTITFTYTADQAGMSNGTVELAVPGDWTPPTTGAGPGHIAATGNGTLSVADDGYTIMDTGLTLSGGQTFTITYTGDPVSGSEEWTTYQQSSDPDATGADAQPLDTSPTISVVSADGSGTVDAQDQLGNDPPYVPSGTDGNTLTFTYTADDGGLANGSVTLAVPSNWPAPVADDGTDTTELAQGFTTLSGPDGATLTTNGQLITVSGLNMAGGDQLTITYGDTSFGGPGASAPAATGQTAWTMQEQSSSDGTLTNLTAGSPTVTVAAADGSGTMIASPTGVHLGDTNKTLKFTYTAADGGLSNGTVGLVVPSDWTPPTTDPGPGRVSLSGAPAGASISVGDDGQTVYVTGLTMNAGQTFTIVYSGATPPDSSGAEDWETLEQFSDPDGFHDTITDLTNGYPSIAVVAADGSGTMTSDTASVQKGSTGNTLTFTYTADDGGLANGTLTFAVPTGWPAPTADSTKASYTTFDNSGLEDANAQMTINKQLITITGLDMNGGDSFTITYGDPSSDPGTGVTAPNKTGNPNWTTMEQSLPGTQGKLTSIAIQPRVPVIAKPKVTGFAPTTVAIGGTVTIKGSDLAGVDDPTAGAIAFFTPDGSGGFIESDADITTAVVNATGTALTVALPGDITDGKWTVQVTNDGVIGDATDPGTSAVSKTALTVVDTPEVDSVDPSEAAVGAPITLTGLNLKGSTVWFPGGANNAGVSAKPTKTKVNGDGSVTLTVKVPLGAVSGDIYTVTNGADSNTNGFTVDYLTPLVKTIAPGVAAPGATLTLIGSHFTGVQDTDNGGAVSVGGESLDPSQFAWVSDTKLVVTIPSDMTAGAQPIVVSNSGGDSTAKNVTVVIPTITGVTPTSVKGGKPITITGTSLTGATLVTFAGGKTAKPKVAKDGKSMTVTVPKGAQSGSFQVAVAGIVLDSGGVSITVSG